MVFKVLTHNFLWQGVSEIALQQHAKLLSSVLQAGDCVFLSGELGAGKTTWVRYFLQSLGHVGRVKSPSYALVEPYEDLSTPVFHFDFYRIESSGSLVGMGLEDYFSRPAIILVEWPQVAQAYLPTPSVLLELVYQSEHERTLCCETQQDRLGQVLSQWVWNGS